ncbi:MAG: hypothetical protein AAB354_02640 [candidate division KSB1 bacterium]
MPFFVSMNSTVMWISLTVGILLFVIGHFAGGRLTMGRIWMCVGVVTLISVLALPAPMALYHVVKEQFAVNTYVENQPVTFPKQNSVASSSPTTATEQKENAPTTVNQVAPVQAPMSFQVLTLVMHILWTGFLVSMGIYLYETLIVTAQEAEKR